MRKVADFSTYQSLRSMSYNQFNRWVRSVYTTAYQDGYDDGGKEFGDTPLVLDEDSLYELLISVPGIGDKMANKIVDRFLERWDENELQVESERERKGERTSQDGE